MSSPCKLSNATQWRFPISTDFYMDDTDEKEGYRSTPISVNPNGTLRAIINSSLLNSELHSDISNNIEVSKYKKDGTLIEKSIMTREQKGSNIIDEQFDLFTSSIPDECYIITIWIKCPILSIVLYE